MNEKVVYISGPISNIPGGNKGLFSEAATQLKNKGYLVRNPHEFCSDIPTDTDWGVYMRRCIQVLMECTDILMLPNYEFSKGALLEFEIAQALKITIHYSLASLSDNSL